MMRKKIGLIIAVLILAICVFTIPVFNHNGKTGFSLISLMMPGSDIWSTLDERYVQFAENFDPEKIRSVSLHSNSKTVELTEKDDIQEVFDMLDELEAVSKGTIYDSYVPLQKYFLIEFNTGDGIPLYVQFRGQDLVGYTSLETVYRLKDSSRLISYVEKKLPTDFLIWEGDLADHGGLLSADLSPSDGWEIIEEQSDSQNILYVKTADEHWEKGSRELAPSVYIHFIREFEGRTAEEFSEYVHSVAETLKSDHEDLTVDEMVYYCGQYWIRITLSDSSIQLYTFIEGGLFCIEFSNADLSEAAVQWIVTSIQFALE